MPGLWKDLPGKDPPQGHRELTQRHPLADPHHRHLIVRHPLLAVFPLFSLCILD
ncbi:hypothetical protein BHE74_00029086 [Ensete ventricosum]|nr:hypothetical protein GW17_00037503 [Ensete ventricosum]RWW63710.1 hypothetical protein BHE74_00029086 [Ensete ventricosum]RZR90017.1 hypothetical protein BHM03_00017832 [Ensete ventricosum]